MAAVKAADLPACCQRERVSVRIPDPRGATPASDNLHWHQDGGGPLGNTRHMILWASEQPTELRLPDGEECTGAPYEMIWIDNYVVFHRQPSGTDETRRWFWAIRCSGA